jgi:histone acetyltransferase (RNA polymerase elongator complex component)
VVHAGWSFPTQEQLRTHINAFLNYKGTRSRRVQISFYGGNFLGLPPEEIQFLLKEASLFVTAGDAHSIRFSTRPDTISSESLELIKNYPVRTVEIGVQSMDDEVLRASGRGHSAHDTTKAVGLLRERGYDIGLQMMVGLPEDTWEKSLNTGRAIADLFPDFVRIYPTVVLKGSLLARWHDLGRYTPLSLDESVSLVKELWLEFKVRGIRVIRMGLQASEELDQGQVAAGPYHPAFGHLVFSEIFLDRAVALLKNDLSEKEEICIAVHSRSISRMRGLKNKNIEILKKMFQIKKVRIAADPNIPDMEVVIRDPKKV